MEEAGVVMEAEAEEAMAEVILAETAEALEAEETAAGMPARMREAILRMTPAATPRPMLAATLLLMTGQMMEHKEAILLLRLAAKFQ